MPFFNFLDAGERLDVNIEGYIDLIEKDDAITEFKTSNQAMNQNDVDDHIQLTAYSYAYQICDAWSGADITGDSHLSLDLQLSLRGGWGDTD